MIEIMDFLAGALGGLTAIILQGNTLELPKQMNGKLCLGFLGGMVIGGVAGMTIDGQFITAFMGGFMGKEILHRFMDLKQFNILSKSDYKRNIDTK